MEQVRKGVLISTAGDALLLAFNAAELSVI